MRTDYDVRVIYDVSELARLGKGADFQPAPHSTGAVPEGVVIATRTSDMSQAYRDRLKEIDEEFDRMIELLV